MLIRAKGFRALALVASAVILMMLPNARVFLYQISAPQSMYPWFLFGLMALHRWRIWEDKRITIPATIFTIGLSLFTGNIYTNGLSFYTEGSYLIQILGSLKASALFVIRTFWGFCGIVSTMWLVSLCKRRIGTCRAVEIVGENTLGIYLLHVLILRYCKLGEISFFSALLYTAVLLIVCTLLSYWIRRLRPLSLVIFGK